MNINTTELTKLSIADLWALMKYAEENMIEANAEKQRLIDDEDANEKATYCWVTYMSFSSEFEKRVSKLRHKSVVTT